MNVIEINMFQHAMESRDGKCKFFTDEVNKQLLE